MVYIFVHFGCRDMQNPCAREIKLVGDYNTMFEEGTRLSRKFGKACTIKVPCTPDGLRVCRELSRDLVNVNVTLIFSAAQAILAAKSGAKYVSPFVGRVDDNSFSGIELISSRNHPYTLHITNRC